jgi:hypothetical protein
MAAAKLELSDDDESERIIRWRLSELSRAGFEWRSAVVLAARPDVDLHRATALLRRGCPVDTALRILL